MLLQVRHQGRQCLRVFGLHLPSEICQGRVRATVPQVVQQVRDVDRFLLWLLLDSRGVDLTIAYHSIFASRHLLEVLIFQGTYPGFARFRPTLEHKTLESNKSHCYKLSDSSYPTAQRALPYRCSSRPGGVVSGAPLEAPAPGAACVPLP
jgi:hypothetical protein